MTITYDKLKSERAQSKFTAESFEEVFQAHWHRVYSILFRLVGEPAEAEDLALEVFWRLYRRPPSLEGEVSLGGWFYRVAIRLGFNALRARRRRRNYEEKAGLQALELNSSPDPAVEVEHAEERRSVQRVLAQMKPRNAQLLVLRHSGLTYAELAAALGVAASSIGTLLVRAEQEFERLYQSREGE